MGNNAKMFTKKDLFFSVLTGLITGVIAWRVFLFLNAPEFYWFPSVGLVILTPILWIIGVNLGYFLGRWMPFFNQFGKFAAIGFTNAAVYFGTLNLLIASSDIASGFWYSVFVTISFIVGMLHSYIWNKHWAFEAAGSQGGGAEFGKFIIVSTIAGAINVVTASLLVNVIGPRFGVSEEVWANVGGVAGSAVALVLSFIGFKIAVFKK